MSLISASNCSPDVLSGDRIQRGADFVAHVGEEFRFRPCGRFRCGFGADQFPVAFGEIALQALVTQNGLHAGGEFAELKWLGDVVGGAQFEAANLFTQIPLCRENDDWNVCSLGSGLELLENLEARDVRKTEVEQDQIKPARSNLAQTFLASGDGFHQHPFAGQTKGHQLLDAEIVVDEQNAQVASA